MSQKAAYQFSTMFQMISAAIEIEKDHLSKLDGAIGDGDHGITMSIGFRAINAEIGKLNLETVGPAEIMATAATAFLNAVGASTGPLYATAFRHASEALAESNEDDLTSHADMIRAFVTGISERGKAQRGDKTMLDAWMPAADAAEKALTVKNTPALFWSSVIDAANTGAIGTRSMIATKGRAARVGERSLGHIDPGAASSVIILKAMAMALSRF
jgi:phosphoenolpyruvate---glycerone phosphotransferase subunit DhaL